ncbi:MAG: hypothetical protein H6746_20015 [Deltaproteobacteria bacterium]|nr:hypothetical protein [Deltaproteobacteria bacterium]
MHVTCHPERAAVVGNSLGLGPASDEVVGIPDSLSCGPAAPVRDLTAWCAEREAWWRSSDGAPGEDLPENHYPGLLETCERALAAPELTLWLEPGANYQLLAGWLAELLLARGADVRVDLVQVERDALLTPTRLGRGRPRKRASLSDLERLAEVWRVWCAPTPDPILEYIANPARPALSRAALRTLLDHYPRSQDGLNHWEWRCLHALRDHSPVVARAICDTLIRPDGDGCEEIGDLWLLGRLRRLGAARLRFPLLEFGSTSVPRIGFGTARLTDAGESVIAGTADAITLNGIEDRVGGVTLKSPGGPVWRRSESGLERTDR